MSRKQDSDREPGRHDWRGWLRYSSYSAAILLLLASAMFLYARMDQFLAGDPRFTLAAPSADGESTALRIVGALHTPRAAIFQVFSEDFGRSVYLLPLEQRRRALLEIDWVRDATVSAASGRTASRCASWNANRSRSSGCRRRRIRLRAVSRWWTRKARF